MLDNNQKVYDTYLVSNILLCIKFWRSNRKIFKSNSILICIKICFCNFGTMWWRCPINKHYKFTKSILYMFQIIHKYATVKLFVLSKQLFAFTDRQPKITVLLREPVTLTTGLLSLEIHFFFLIRQSYTNMDSSCTRTVQSS